MTVERLEIARPDDWHLHLRDGAMLEAIVGFSAAVFGRAIVMPNLAPPVRTPAEAEAYLARIRAALPDGHPFEPLMTAYMTDDADPGDIRAGFESGIFRAVKLYPAGATTNSAFGVTRMEAIRPVLAEMERIGMPLLVHGEVVDPEVDVFDREAVYIERVLDPMRRDFPGLKVVLEHVTTAEAVDCVRAADRSLGATITPHHSDDQPERPLPRRAPSAHVLPPRGEAGTPPARAAASGDLGRFAVFPRHRFRAPPAPRQGNRLRLRRNLQCSERAAMRRAGFR